MKSGLTTSQAITRAYLDRIAAYDSGPFGFHAFITVSDTAMAQAKAADDRRAAGDTSELLGIPVAVKDLYDTKDMPTTDGSLAFEGWRPERDAGQVKRLRDAGAVILGKTNLSEFANSGSYSDSGYGMVWNAFKPSKTSLGSSGGSAVATALSLAGFAMGTQTGVSLYAPSTGASLVSLRGTDGISSGAGVMPLTWLQDFEGPIARTTSDIARILNVTTGTDPDDIATVHADADAKRPADWKTALDPNALQGKKIGYMPSAFDASPSYGQEDGTIDALKARFADIVAAGATMVPGHGRGARVARDRHAHRQPHRGGLAALLRPARQPAVPHGVGDPLLAEGAPVQPRDAEPGRPPDRRGHRQDLRAARRVQGALEDLHGHGGRRRDRLPGLPLGRLRQRRGPDALLRPQQRRPDVQRRPADADPAGGREPARRPDVAAVRRPRVGGREDARLRLRARAAARRRRPPGPGDGAEPAVVTQATAPVGGQVPATLALTMGAPATFGAFTPGVAKDYTATTTANVISTAGDAALTVVRPRPPDERHVRAGLAAQVAFSKAVWTGAGLQRRGHGDLRAAHRGDRSAAYGRLFQDADVHAVDDDAVISEGVHNSGTPL